jgi:hypothetical protein
MAREQRQLGYDIYVGDVVEYYNRWQNRNIVVVVTSIDKEEGTFRGHERLFPNMKVEDELDHIRRLIKSGNPLYR